MTGPIVVVGAGHNGLVAACYLAKAGREVVVVEQLDRPGGGARTEETVPGYRVDLHSAAHNIINPIGGIAGTPGRQAARALLADEGWRRRPRCSRWDGGG